MKLNIQLFASVQSAKHDGRYLKLTVTEESYSVEDNTSTIYWKFESIGGNSSYYSIYNYGVYINGSQVYDGTSGNKTKNYSNHSFPVTKGSKEGRVTITHKPDGSADDVPFTLYGKVYGSGTEKHDGSISLTNIPRASKPTLSSSSVTMNGSVTIYTNRASSSFTHDIWYTFGNTSGTIANNVGTDTEWNSSNGLTDALAEQITSSPSGIATIWCKTWNNGQDIGTETIDITINIPDTLKPTATLGNYSEANPTMQNLNWGVFVQNKSQITTSVSGSGIRYSWPKKYTLQFDWGTTYETTDTTQSFYYTTGIITGTSLTIFGNVQDSRDVWGNGATNVVSLEPYSNPQIYKANASRCDSNGNVSDEGTYLKYEFEGSISPVANNNSHLFQIGYRVKDTGSYQYVTISSNDYYINSTGILNLNLDTSYSYDIQFEAVDTFSTTPIRRQVDTGFDLINWNTSGKAMAIGKVSEAGANEELFEIGMVTDLTTPTDKWTGLNIYSSNRNEASVAYHNQARNQRYVVGYGTNNFDGFGVYNDNNGNVLTISNEGNVSAKQSFRIPKSNALGAGLTNSDGVSIIRDHNNSNITIDATGGGIYFGYDTTNYIDFFRGLASINNAGGFHAKTIQQQIVSNGTGATSGVYVKLCNLTFGFHNQGEFANFRIYIGDGNNGRDNQNAFIDLTMQLGWTGNNDGRLGCNFELHPLNTNFDLNNVNVIVIANSNINYDIYLWTDKYYCVPNYTYDCSSNVIITNDGATSTTYPSGTQCDIRGEVIGNTAQIGDTSIVDMAHHFQIGEILICFGIRNIHSVANGTATDTVGFGAYFRYPPIVNVTAMTGAPNTYEKGAGVTNITTDRFDLTHYRTNNTTTGYQWIAIGLRA